MIGSPRAWTQMVYWPTCGWPTKCPPTIHSYSRLPRKASPMPPWIPARPVPPRTARCNPALCSGESWPMVQQGEMTENVRSHSASANRSRLVMIFVRMPRASKAVAKRATTSSGWCPAQPPWTKSALGRPLDMSRNYSSRIKCLRHAPPGRGDRNQNSGRAPSGFRPRGRSRARPAFPRGSPQ